MKLREYVMRELLCAYCSLVFLAFAGMAFAATAKEATPAPAAKPAEVKPAPEDPLGRATPYGTVFGFLRAADKGDYEVAARFLEGKQPAEKKAVLARHLKVVLNRGLKIGLEDLSKVPEGRLDDDLNVYLEKVGTAIYGNESLDIVLRRTTRADSPPIWLFSSETLRGVTAAAEQLDVAWTEAMWPESFRERTFLSYPVFLLINQVVIILILLVAAWIFTRVLVAVMRPLFLRQGGEFGETALTRITSLLLLIIFSAMLHIVAQKAITMAGRLVFTTLANVLMVVAVSWLAVRITKLATRAKILRLQERGMPSSIAAVELSGWLVICLFVIAGLFLVLRSLGFEVTAAVAGLGVGGIAIAFAAQKTLENLFGTFTIVTDKPIQVGDYFQAANVEGTVESIGLRSTRIRTPDRAVVTMPNGQLAGMTIGNLTHRDKFLFRHNIRLRYGTTPNQLREVLGKVAALMCAHPKLEAASVRTRLMRFGDSSVEIEAYAYVLTRSGPAFLGIQEELLLAIMDVVEASGTGVTAPALNAPVASLPAAEARSRESTPLQKPARAHSAS